MNPPSSTVLNGDNIVRGASSNSVLIGGRREAEMPSFLQLEHGTVPRLRELEISEWSKYNPKIYS